MSKTQIIRLGRQEYTEAYRLQTEMVYKREAGLVPDTLILVEYNPVFISGQNNTDNRFRMLEEALEREGVEIHSSAREGHTAYYGPGQIVVHPILEHTKFNNDLNILQKMYEEVIIKCLRNFGIEGGPDARGTGVWVGSFQIASMGSGMGNVGFAVNVNPNMAHYSKIYRSGVIDRGISSVYNELANMGKDASFLPFLAEVEEKLIEAFGEVFELNFNEAGEKSNSAGEFPAWLQKKVPVSSETRRTKAVLKELGLKNVCQGGKCPNISTCYGKDTATFLILGDTCTRRCRMCPVPKGKPVFPDLSEAERVAQAVCEMRLRHVVITSVTRDDLPDGGGGVFAATIRSIREIKPTTLIEVMTPDFRGDVQALTEVIKARPSIFNHNLETVPRLYYRVRPQADYRLSLDLLAKAKKIDPGIKTKSGLLVGLGENFDEVLQVMKDLRGANCDILTIGQYLQPSQSQLPVAEYVKPEVFKEYEKLGKEMGFAYVASGPFVRSSFQPDRNT